MNEPISLEHLGTVMDPVLFPRLSPIEGLWQMGKHALAHAARMTVPKDHPFARHEPDPDRLPDQVALPTQDVVLRIVVFVEPQYRALATSCQNNLIAGVYHGLPLAVPGLCTAFWSNPAFAPWIGDVSRLAPRPSEGDGTVPLGLEDVWWAATSGDIETLDTPERRRSRDNLLRLYRSLCPVRRAAAAYMIHAAFLFLWHHEFAHLLIGHVEGIRKGYGVEGLREVIDDDAPDPVPQVLSQMMEIQADTLGLNFTLGQAHYRLLRALEAGTVDKPFPAGEPNTPLTPRQVTIVSAMACFIPWLIFQTHRVFGKRPESVQSHPPLWFRSWMVLQSAKERWSGHPQSEALWRKLVEAVGEMARAHPLYCEWLDGFAGERGAGEFARYQQQIAGGYASFGEKLRFSSRIDASRR